MSHGTQADSRASTAIDLYAEDEHWSEHEEEDRQDRHHHFRSYYSTTLVVQSHITLADVEVEAMTESRLRDMRAWLEAKCERRHCALGVVDPRAELKAQRTHGDVETLVSYDEVTALARMAERVMSAQADASREESKAEPQEHHRIIERHLARVVHDHTRSQAEQHRARCIRRSAKEDCFKHGNARRGGPVKQLSKRLALSLIHI